MDHTGDKWEITTKPDHLKGFLKSLKPQDLYGIIYSQENGEVAIVLAGIIRRHKRKEKDQACNNARLIAAAPKMYAYLERLAATGHDEAKQIISEIAEVKN